MGNNFGFYPFKQAICRGRLHGHLLTSVAVCRAKSHRTKSTLFAPTHFWSKLYPASSWMISIFSFWQEYAKTRINILTDSYLKLFFIITLGICCRSPSKRCTPIFGFARRASNTVCTLERVDSVTRCPWLLDKRALPFWKTWLTEPPILSEIFPIAINYMSN